VGTTTSRTNFYETLAGVKDLSEPDISSSEDGLLTDNKSKSSDERDKKIMIGVLVGFGGLAVIAAIAYFVVSHPRAKPV